MEETNENISELTKALGLKGDYNAKHYSGVNEKLEGIWRGFVK